MAFSSRPDLFLEACEFGLEGMVCKRADRPYQAGRSKHWMKVKNRKQPIAIGLAETSRKGKKVPKKK